MNNLNTDDVFEYLRQARLYREQAVREAALPANRYIPEFKDITSNRPSSSTESGGVVGAPDGGTFEATHPRFRVPLRFYQRFYPDVEDGRDFSPEEHVDLPIPQGRPPGPELVDDTHPLLSQACHLHGGVHYQKGFFSISLDTFVNTNLHRWTPKIGVGLRLDSTFNDTTSAQGFGYHSSLTYLPTSDVELAVGISKTGGNISQYAELLRRLVLPNTAQDWCAGFGIANTRAPYFVFRTPQATTSGLHFQMGLTRGSGALTPTEKVPGVRSSASIFDSLFRNPVEESLIQTPRDFAYAVVQTWGTFYLASGALVFVLFVISVVAATDYVAVLYAIGSPEKLSKTEYGGYHLRRIAYLNLVPQIIFVAYVLGLLNVVQNLLTRKPLASKWRFFQKYVPNQLGTERCMSTQERRQVDGIVSFITWALCCFYVYLLRRKIAGAAQHVQSLSPDMWLLTTATLLGFCGLRVLFVSWAMAPLSLRQE